MKRTECEIFPFPHDVDVAQSKIIAFGDRYHVSRVNVSIKGSVTCDAEYGILADWFMVMAFEEKRGVLLQDGRWVKPVGKTECLIRLEGKAQEE